MMTHSKHRVSLTSRAIIAICLVFVAAAAMPPGAWSTGIMLYEQSTPDVGPASAGQGARAQDAGTVFTNPAGMTQLKDSQLLGGIVPNFGNFTFSPNRVLKNTN
jgi:long-subunit fatty acid transport protein